MSPKKMMMNYMIQPAVFQRFSLGYVFIPFGCKPEMAPLKPSASPVFGPMHSLHPSLRSALCFQSLVLII